MKGITHSRSFCWALLAMAIALPARSHADVMFVTDDRDGTVKRFDGLTGQYMGSFGSGFLAVPTGVAVDAHGVAYVADFAKNEVFRFNAFTGNYMGAVGSGSLISPEGLAFDSHGTLFVADGNGISRFDPLNGSDLGHFANGFLQYGGSGLAIDANDVAFVGDATYGQVQRFDTRTGNWMGSVGTGLAPGAFGVAINADSKLFVTSLTNNNVSRLNEFDGGYGGSYGSGFLNGAAGLAFDGYGTSFVTSYYGGRVDRFNPYTGAYMGSIGDGILGNPRFIAVVPEPSTLFIFAVGTLGLSASFRRRRAGSKRR